MNNFEDIARLIEALRPWLSQLVIIGGWAHRLHRFHPLANPPAYLPLQTRDADIAISSEAHIEGNIDEALVGAGFRAEYSGENTPPVTHYWLDDQDQGFYAEFLVPLTGSRLNRDKTLVPLTMRKAGVTAQKLRYLDILLIRPWAIGIDDSVGVPLKSPAEILISNPVSFIVQKLLIQSRRPPEKKAQDALYIHDTLELLGGDLDKLKEIWLTEIRPSLPGKTVQNVENLYKEQFGAVTDIIRDAAQIPQNRSLSPDSIQRACAYGLEEIFSD
jgi:hypothetical protein